MCGYFLTNSTLVDNAAINRIRKYIDFRGPDYQSGIIDFKGWKLYHARLSIIDPENDNSNQPFFDESGGVLLFNGEILNYSELAERYYDEDFYSDTALLSRLIVDERLELSELDGFFSFAYVDVTGTLKWLVRDQFGVKPLYYHRDLSGALTISSEPKPLALIFNLPVNNEAIEEYRAARSPIFSSSYFDGVESLAPGCCLINGEYFNLKDELEFEKSRECDQSDLHCVLKTAIESRLVADVPVGLCLSMGVDSNLIYNLADFDKLYSIGFEGDPDFEYLRKNGPAKLNLIKAEHSQYASDLDFLLKLRGEPLSVPNEVLLFQLAKKAKADGVKVLLSGEGADEFFAGYDRIFKAFSNLNAFDIDLFIDLYCYEKPAKYSSVYKKFESIFLSIDLEPFEKVRWFFVKYHMPVLFRRLDFAMMAAGVEGREPLANRHTFNLAKKLAAKTLIGNKLGKIPLRRLLADLTTENFAYMDKVGFPVDLTKVFPEISDQTSYDIWFSKNLEILNK
ncbi:asparagine synthetase B family protein [Pseudidiomarina marina]|uniref:asparagine synthase (glutamine-hydrolyzing) n=1 Tax=Pseudidiomarina marina TaxID=502366 RepID=A0A432YF94_9GAMM|nr:asparagine synthetase B [Pseudidiomarina marina]RUO59621.1 asparagine synthase [Pseudidiomarina marina]